METSDLSAYDLVLTTYGVKRSPRWPEVRAAHLLKQPWCLVCGAADHKVFDMGLANAWAPLQVHHKYPVHFLYALDRQDLELDERNLFTLCVDHSEEHHLLIGHLDSWESYNPALEKQIQLCRGFTSVQIRNLEDWRRAQSRRPISLKEMSGKERAQLRLKLARVLPRK